MSKHASPAWIVVAGKPSFHRKHSKACALTPPPMLRTTAHSAMLRRSSIISAALGSHPEAPREPSITHQQQGWDAIEPQTLLDAVKFNEAGLVPAIAQQWDTGEVLMMAWMNRESIKETMRGGRAVYFSRSRKELWRKGDTSGQTQIVRDLLLDCDGDTILLKVEQLGVACHTGRRSCFFTSYKSPDGEPLVVADVLMDPKKLYNSENSRL